MCDQWVVVTSDIGLHIALYIYRGIFPLLSIKVYSRVSYLGLISASVLLAPIALYVISVASGVWNKVLRTVLLVFTACWHSSLLFSLTSLPAVCSIFCSWLKMMSNSFKLFWAFLNCCVKLSCLNSGANVLAFVCFLVFHRFVSGLLPCMCLPQGVRCIQ